MLNDEELMNRQLETDSKTSPVSDPGKHQIPVIYSTKTSVDRERIEADLKAWLGSATVEQMDSDHAVMVIRPGGALKLMNAGIAQEHNG